MKTLAALGLLLFTLAPGQAAADVNGKWTGSFTILAPDGTPRAQTIEMNLTQKDKELTGTAGPNADRQWPLAKGAVSGTSVTFDVQSDGPVISFTLTLANDRLTGEASAAGPTGEKLNAKVDAGRVK